MDGVVREGREIHLDEFAAVLNEHVLCCSGRRSSKIVRLRTANDSKKYSIEYFRVLTHVFFLAERKRSSKPQKDGFPGGLNSSAADYSSSKTIR